MKLRKNLCKSMKLHHYRPRCSSFAPLHLSHRFIILICHLYPAISASFTPVYAVPPIRFNLFSVNASSPSAEHIQEFFNETVTHLVESNQTKEIIYHTTETGVEVKIEELKLHVKKQTLELKDGTNIMGLIVFCTVFGIILGQLGPDGECPFLQFNLFGSYSSSVLENSLFVFHFYFPFFICLPLGQSWNSYGTQS